MTLNLEQHRIEFRDIALSKFRQACHMHTPYSDQSEYTIEKLGEWLERFNSDEEKSLPKN